MAAGGVDCPACRRADWYPRWEDADGDCRNTRQEMLIEEDTVAALLDAWGCRVLEDRWVDPYTGVVHTDPRVPNIMAKTSFYVLAEYVPQG